MPFDVFRKACLASRKEKESIERFERATEAGTKVYDVKTHVHAKFERHRRPRSGGLTTHGAVEDVCVIFGVRRSYTYVLSVLS